MDKDVLKLMLARLARWGAVVLVTHAVNKGWIAAGETDAATAEVAQFLLEGILVICAALAAGWLAVRQKLHMDSRVATERERTQIALQMPAGATFEDLEAIRRNQARQMRGRGYEVQS